MVPDLFGDRSRGVDMYRGGPKEKRIGRALTEGDIEPRPRKQLLLKGSWAIYDSHTKWIQHVWLLNLYWGHPDTTLEKRYNRVKSKRTDLMALIFVETS